MPKATKKSAKKTTTKASATADPRYPIGKHTAPATITQKDLNKAIDIIEAFPKALHKSLKKLNNKKLDTPYREGGWTVRQLVHHIADSHMTALHRVSKALTEDTPEITGYNEGAMAKLADHTAPIEWSTQILEGVHARWTILLKSLKPADFQRSFKHAERGPMTIAQATLLYEWHSKHHLAHITTLRKQKGW
jgi:hypothetical protein